MADLFPSSAFDNISLNDDVIIVGPDDCKGLIGIVVAIKNSEISANSVFTVELQANGKKIQRPVEHLKRYFADH